MTLAERRPERPLALPRARASSHGGRGALSTPHPIPHTAASRTHSCEVYLGRPQQAIRMYRTNPCAPTQYKRQAARRRTWYKYSQDSRWGAPDEIAMPCNALQSSRSSRASWCSDSVVLRLRIRLARKPSCSSRASGLGRARARGKGPGVLPRDLVMGGRERMSGGVAPRSLDAVDTAGGETQRWASSSLFGGVFSAPCHCGSAPGFWHGESAAHPVITVCVAMTSSVDRRRRWSRLESVITWRAINTNG